jgi:hypothetical protein
MGTWIAGPLIPNGQFVSDAPAASMVNGKVLCVVSPGGAAYNSTGFYEYDPIANEFVETRAPGNIPTSNPTDFRMLDLPDGNVLFGPGGGQLYEYIPDSAPLAVGQPTIISVATNYYRSYHLTGMLFNGISEGAGYGDDAQMNSNYPLVRMTNNASGDVFYARTYNWSSTGVMTGTNIVSTEFMVPEDLPAGDYSLVVVANGNSSAPVPFSFAPDDLFFTLPKGFASRGPVGGPFTPASQAYFLSNLGTSPLAWSLVNTSAWLNLSLTGATLAPGGQSTVIASVGPAAPNLPPGIYTANVWFTNLTTGAAQSIPFRLEINPLLQNGGFEYGSFADWVLSVNQVNISHVAGNYNGIGGVLGSPHSGKFSAFLGMNSSTGYLTQTVPTVPGQSYLLSLFMNSSVSAGGTNEFAVSWDGITLFDQVGLATTGWTNLQFVVWATSDASDLEFTFDNPMNNFILDDVTLSNLPPVLAIASQPESQTVAAGANTILSVLAGGQPPFYYQWQRNGTNLLDNGEFSGSSTSNLILSNAVVADTGNFTVKVSNGSLSVTSVVVTLTVLDCAVPAPSGLISWWAGNGTANDLAGTNNGALQYGATYAPGEVGAAFSFNGVNQCVSVPDSPSWAFGTNEFTLELWANFGFSGGPQAMLATDEGGGPTHKWIFWLNGSTLQLFLDEVTNTFSISSAEFFPILNQWYHIALTRSGSDFEFYVNGGLYSLVNSSLSMPSPKAPLTIGDAEGGFCVNGQLDDIRIYNRALSASEIQAIYEAGGNGMCAPSTAPPFNSIPIFIGDPPSDQNLIVGGTASFVALAECDAPFSYQWRKNGLPVPGANSVTYVFGPVQLSDAGAYDVVASNQFGGVASRAASLSIFPNQNTNCAVSAPSGLVSWWGGQLDANDRVGTNNGTLANGVAFASSETGYAFELNGVDQFIWVPNSPSWAFGTNPFTLEVWANFSSSGGPQALLANDEGGGNTRKWIFWLSGSSLQLFLDEITNNYSISSAEFTPTLGQWNHIALTRNATTFSFYINGEINSTTTSSVEMPSPLAPLSIGNAEGGFFFDGLLDDVRIYSRALSAPEIQAIYQADVGGMCPPSPLMFTGSPGYRGTNGIVLNTSLRSGQSYEIETSTNLATGIWFVLTNFVAGTAPMFQVTNGVSTNIPQQFYRIASP